MSESARARARRLASQYVSSGDPIGWFEALYQMARGDARQVQWADLAVNPHFAAWTRRRHLIGVGQRALVVGCGLGDDAEHLAGLGFRVVAFDVSPTCIGWCRRRFPASAVYYTAADLFYSPPDWQHAFDFVLEAYTLQVLPADLRPAAVERIVGYVRSGGTLLVVSRGREPGDDPGQMPWPLTRAELDRFVGLGLQEVSFSDFLDLEDPPVRRFVAEFRAKEAGQA